MSDKGRISAGAILARILLSRSDVKTKRKFFHASAKFPFLMFSQETSRYRIPPCINFELLELAPEAKVFFSNRTTLKPRKAASRAIPAPAMPPPMTAMS
jgi:hypothetical protein